MSNSKVIVAPVRGQNGVASSNGKSSPEQLVPAALLNLDGRCAVPFDVLRAAALQTAANSVVVTDRQGTVLWVNPTFSRVTGYSPEEVIGGTPRIWSSGKHARGFFQVLWDTILAGRPWHGIILNRRKDGSEYSEEMTILPVFSATGEIANFISLRQDVTEHERDSEMLRRSEERYGRLIANLPDVTWSAAENGEIIYISSNVEAVYGFTAEEICARREELWLRRIHPEDVARVLQSLQRLFSKNQTFDEEYRLQRKDGEWIWIHDRALRTYLENGLRFADGVLSDITSRKRAEQALLQSERRYRLLFENNLAGVFRATSTGKLLECNPAMVSMLGYDSQQHLLQRSTSEILFNPAEEPALIAALAEGGVHNYEIRLKRKDGSPVWALHNVILTREEDGRPVIEGTVFDISRRRRAEQEVREREDRLRLILESTAEAIYGIDLEGRCTFCNPACVRLLGYHTAEELLGKHIDALIHHSRPEGQPLGLDQCATAQTLRQKSGVHVDSEVLSRADGTSFPVEYWAYPQWKDGQVIGAVAAFIDITERKEVEERVKYLAYYDAVTGLPNRTLLQDRLSKALADARRRKEKLAILFLDLDHFKVINDSLGHSAGDSVLKEVAARLKKWVRDRDTVARLGGDEFVVLLHQIKDIGDVGVAARRMLDTITAEIVVERRPLSIGCSIGISIFPDHGRDAVALTKNADTALYCAKEKGRNNFQFFTSQMNEQVMERLNLESDLRGALQRNELFLMYQPQLDVTTGRLIGAEALLRWRHPKLGLIPPDKFIRIAENTGLIIPIGEWVLATACTQARQWQDEGLPAIPVAVNVSAVQFRQEDFLQLIKRVLDQTGLAPGCLELELTESLLMSNAEVIVSMLRALKQTGVKLSIDDFGTGYSSLSYLRHFPVYKLKVDRSFVCDITANPDNAAITATIISMAKSLNLKAIAEGVETEEQVTFLRRHDCDEVQGYYFSKPLRAGDFAQFARSLPSPPAVPGSHSRKSEGGPVCQ